MSKTSDIYINIIGAGLAGMSAAITLARKGCHVRLFSVQPSERAQSNLAEGGINGALDVMGENDSAEEHYTDTMKGGCYLASPAMVKNLTSAAPDIILELADLGVPFHMEEGHIVQRNFGGQKKKRTAYAKSSTGKVLTVALINETRKYEAQELIKRYSHHRFEKLLLSDDGAGCLGVQVIDTYTGCRDIYYGYTIMAVGGLNGFFKGLTTGTTANTSLAQAVLFDQGVEFANLEFIQYHPTTVEITGKRMLISEAARGEGGRLFYYRDSSTNEGKEVEDSPVRCYFMEEKYGDRGNLMPRDVISKEIAMLGKQVYLDLTGLSDDIWKNRLSDMREEIIHYMAVDPAVEPVMVSPGIHYFMGGILVDEFHRTNIEGLYASGECACAYHGANRLGGNSLLGAIFGGKKSAQSLLEFLSSTEKTGIENTLILEKKSVDDFSYLNEKETDAKNHMEDILKKTLGIIRDGKTLENAIEDIDSIEKNDYSDEMRVRLKLSKAMLMCALNRRESRGAHVRADYPETDKSYQKTTVVRLVDKEIKVYFKEVDPE